MTLLTVGGETGTSFCRGIVPVFVDGVRRICARFWPFNYIFIKKNIQNMLTFTFGNVA